MKIMEKVRRLFTQRDRWWLVGPKGFYAPTFEGRLSEATIEAAVYAATLSIERGKATKVYLLGESPDGVPAHRRIWLTITVSEDSPLRFDE